MIKKHNQLKPICSVFISFIILILFVFLLSTNLRIIPDLLRLSTLEEPNKLISLIFTSVITIFSIEIALIVLAFEFFRQKVGQVDIKYFIHN